ncbi:MAG: VWA domain-containing protein [Planctomycetota bacterium]|nr:MAG: VWA domain-containing protein [Planctomycetota bacterium]
MKKILFILFFAFPLAMPLYGKLSKQELQKILKEYNEAIRVGDPYLIGKALEKLAKDDSKRIVKVLCSCALKFQEEKIYEACKNGIRQLKSKEALDYCYQKMKSGPWQIQIFLMESLGHRRDKKLLSILMKNLNSPYSPVVRTALEILGQIRDSKLVHPLILFLKKLEKKKKTGEIHFQTRKVLVKLTGYDYLTGQEWEKWWLAVGSKGGIGATGRTVLQKPLKHKGPRFFTEQITSHRVVFIIDSSASMEEKDPPRMEGRGTHVRRKPIPKAQLPASRMRIERAKNQLIQVIKRLPSQAAFNIIAFNNKVRYWSPKLRKASPSAKSSAIQFVMSLRAEGKTFTYKALEKAFENKKADTFYLLSDGTPTLGPSPGQILEKVTRWNRFRKIKIFTLGFPGVNREFMQKLAYNNFGKYSDIR